MKRYFLISLLAASVSYVSAAVTYSSLAFVSSSGTQTVAVDGLQMSVSGSNLLVSNAGGESHTLPLAGLQKMYFADAQTSAEAVADTTVLITYSGNSASVTIADNIKGYVTATVSGAHVRITQSSNAGEYTSGEITYILTGSSSNGSFYMEGAYKATVSLQGLTLTNPSGAAKDIQNGKRIKLSSKNGTVNTLTDAANGDWKGAFVCKGHTEFQGRGTLNIYGNTANGIYSKEYVEIKNCTINVQSAVKDGLHCQQYFSMASGELNIRGFGGDGIDVEKKNETVTNDAEDTGNFIQTGGTINIYMGSATGEGVSYVGEMQRTGGTLNIIQSTAVEQQTIDSNMPADIYTLLGIRVGTMTPAQAIGLPKGIYIFKQGNTTTKITIK